MPPNPQRKLPLHALLLVIGGGLWWLIDSSNKSAEKARAERASQEYLAATAIKQADLKLENVNLKKASYGVSDFVLDGMVTNNSAFSLGTIYFEVTITDCQNGNCRVVGQTTTSASVTVPAGVEQDYVDRSIDRIIEAQSRTKDFAPQPNVRHSDLGKLTDGELLHMLFDSEIDPHQAQS